MSLLIGAMDAVLLVAKPLVWGAMGLVAILCTLDWAVRTRKLNPFGAVARFTRRSVDPMIAVVERRIVRAGGTPASAPWWTLVIALFAGLSLLALLGFLRDTLVSIHYSVGQGPGGVVRLLVRWAFSIIQLALLVRVITSWVGGTYSWIGRLAHRMTEWFLAPMRRVIPTFGGIDVTPLLAWLLLGVVQSAVMSAL